MGIDADYIKRLVENNRPEDISLDYKRTLNISSDSDKNELRYDVCAFINSSGGLIIYGIDEPTAQTPCNIIGLENLNNDDVIQKMIQILSSNIEPKLPILDINILEIDNKSIWGSPRLTT